MESLLGIHEHWRGFNRSISGCVWRKVGGWDVARGWRGRLGKEEQLKRWMVVSSDRLQCGQEGEGV